MLALVRCFVVWLWTNMCRYLHGLYICRNQDSGGTSSQGDIETGIETLNKPSSETDHNPFVTASHIRSPHNHIDAASELGINQEVFESTDGFASCHRGEPEVGCDHYSVLSTSADTSQVTEYTEDDSIESFASSDDSSNIGFERGIQHGSALEGLVAGLHFSEDRVASLEISKFDCDIPEELVGLELLEAGPAKYPELYNSFYDDITSPRLEFTEHDIFVFNRLTLGVVKEATSSDSILATVSLVSGKSDLNQPSDTSDFDVVLDSMVTHPSRLTSRKAISERSSSEEWELHGQNSYLFSSKHTLGPFGVDGDQLRERWTKALAEDDYETIFSVGSAFSLDNLAV